MNIFQNPRVRLGIVITFIIGIVVIIAIILRTLIGPPACEANFHRDYANRCVRDCPEGQDNDVTTGACVKACSEGLPYLNDDGSLACVQECGGSYCYLPGNEFGRKDTLCQAGICYDPSENSCFKSDRSASVCSPYLICGATDTYQLNPEAVKAGLTSTSQLDQYGCFFNPQSRESCSAPKKKFKWNPSRTSENPSVNDALKDASVCCDSNETALYIPDGPLTGKPVCCLPGSTLTSNYECCGTSLCKDPESGGKTCLLYGYVCTPEGGCPKDFATFNSDGDYTGCCYNEVGSDGVCNNLCTYPSSEMPKSCTSDSQCTPGSGESGGGVCLNGSCQLYCGTETSTNKNICVNDPNTATSSCGKDSSCELAQPTFTTLGGDSAIVQDQAGNDLYICGDNTGKQYWGRRRPLASAAPRPPPSGAAPRPPPSGAETMTITQGFSSQKGCTQLQCLDHFATQGLLGTTLDVTTDSQGNKNLPTTSNVKVESGSCKATINCAAAGITLKDGSIIDWKNQMPKTLNGDDDITMKLHYTLVNGKKVYDGTFEGTGKCIPGTSNLCKFLDTGEYSPYGTLDGIEISNSDRKVVEGSGCAPASTTTSEPYPSGIACMNKFSAASGGVKITPVYFAPWGAVCGPGGNIDSTNYKNGCVCLVNATLSGGKCTYNATGKNTETNEYTEGLNLTATGSSQISSVYKTQYLSLKASLSTNPYKVTLQNGDAIYNSQYSAAVVVMTYTDSNNVEKYVGLSPVKGTKSTPVLSLVESNQPLGFYYWYNDGPINPISGQIPINKGFLRFGKTQTTGAPDYWGTPIGVKDGSNSKYAYADPTWDTQTTWNSFQNGYIITIIYSAGKWYLGAIQCFTWNTNVMGLPLTTNSVQNGNSKIYYGTIDSDDNFEFTNTNIDLATPLDIKYVLSYKPGATVNPDDKFTQTGVKNLLTEISESSSSVTFDFIDDYVSR